MWARLKCWLFHQRYVMRLPGYDDDEAQCCCYYCGLMWIENRPDLWSDLWSDQTNNAHKQPR